MRAPLYFHQMKEYQKWQKKIRNSLNNCQFDFSIWKKNPAGKLRTSASSLNYRTWSWACQSVGALNRDNTVFHYEISYTVKVMMIFCLQCESRLICETKTHLTVSLEYSGWHGNAVDDVHIHLSFWTIHYNLGSHNDAWQISDHLYYGMSPNDAYEVGLNTVYEWN